jgi:hypothetical protein
MEVLSQIERRKAARQQGIPQAQLPKEKCVTVCAYASGILTFMNQRRTAKINSLNSQ